MFVQGGIVHYSASDLTAAVKCEWAVLRLLDAKLGRIPRVEDPADSMMERAGRLGTIHEEQTLARLRDEFGIFDGGAGGVAEIPPPEPSTDPDALRAAAEQTLAALRAGADVVFQATFYDGRFVGFADFVIRTNAPEGPVYETYDTKLARSAKVPALLQLAAYSSQLRRLGVPLGPDVHLLLGDGRKSTHRLADVLPVYLDRSARLLQMIDERVADPAPLVWGAEGYSACGRCAACSEQIAASRDPLLVARLSGGQRTRLAAAGVRTIDELADGTGEIDGIAAGVLARLRDQARLQLAGEERLAEAPTEGPHPVLYRVHDPAGLAGLPAPDRGDVFFDFEGDPLWNDGDIRFWGLEYLFGVLDHDESGEHFRPFWAHDRAEEKRALLDFLEYATERRRRHPDMHIYHYADYERSHLQQLCARHGVGEAMLDELLRENVFVDLYPIVLASIRISERSYSLKKLEPLYMGDELRSSDVTTATESIDAYVEYSRLRDAGSAEEAARLLDEIADYNRYDCVSTLRLRDWLLARADEAGVARRLPPPVADDPADAELGRQEDVVRDRLLASLADIPAAERTADQAALGLAAAAIEYHRREAKSFWWEHFNRQVSPIDEWADQRDVLVVESAAVVGGWERRGRKRSDSRILRLQGRLAPASRLDVGDRPHVMYDHPVPAGCTPVPTGQRGEHGRAEVLEIAGAGEIVEVLLEESTGEGIDAWHEFPIALTPAAPIRTSSQRSAILEWGRAVADGLPALHPEPSLDVLRRVAPRLRDGGTLTPLRDPDVAGSIVSAVRRLDRSYLAVQGPPGSGKTYVGAEVIARLVRDEHWTVGIVAQSHEVVENLLRRAMSFGIDAAQVGKRPPGRGYAAPPQWTVLEKNEHVLPFLLRNRSRGALLGGTAWDFSNAAKVPPNGLDLLVIDEAGQFSLANTIAVGVSARRLLLLGDPQQLPQVSQGLHPEPVDRSALGWLSDGHDVLPPELGFFLASSWRMHPELCAAVSELSYEGRLASHTPETTDRRLDGVRPGLHAVPMAHVGNSTESAEEAARVVEIVRAHVGLPWTDPSVARAGDPLRPSDVIVVAPYNAQVDLLRAALDGAGLRETPVGTVDKFQGQEAAVAVISLTASSADDVPRGIGFLLLRNRLNVAISRAKWAAYLVHSPALRDHLPHTPQGVADLSGFLRLAGDPS